MDCKVMMQLLMRSKCMKIGRFANSYHHRYVSTQSCEKVRVVVTGMGLVCPLGVGVEKCWSELCNGHSGVTKVQGLGYEGIPCQVAAYVPKDQLKLESRFSKSQLKNLSLSSLYALVAAEEALTQANWKPTDEEDKRATGVAIGMGMVELMDIVENGLVLKEKGFKALSPHFVTRILINMPAGHVSMQYGFSGPNHAVSTACTTGAHAIGDAFNFIQRGAAKVMICGGTEAVISPLSIACFSKVRALCSKYNDEPSKASRPFDSKRCGFVMGEGCGLLVLEELQHAIDRKACIYGEILGYGLSGDAHHVTAPREDGKGVLKCMQAAIQDANVSFDQISHINAHATSTPIGDVTELNAIKQLFGEQHAKDMQITGTKGATGHLLGAAGSVESIFTVLSCYYSLIPPTINLEDSIDKDINIIANLAQKWKVKASSGSNSNDLDDSQRTAITNSFGFGGTNASLVFSSICL